MLFSTTFPLTITVVLRVPSPLTITVRDVDVFPVSSVSVVVLLLGWACTTTLHPLKNGSTKRGSGNEKQSKESWSAS